jgi:hypothetical protein
MAASPGLLNGRTPSPTGGGFYAPLYARAEQRTHGTSAAGRACAARVGFKQMETLAGWNDLAHPTRGEHTGRGLGRTPFDWASLGPSREVHTEWTGNAPKELIGEDEGSRPLCLQKSL